MALSVVAQYDDLIRLSHVLADGAEKEFLKFVEQQDTCRMKWLQAVQECQRLQEQLKQTHHVLTDMEGKLEHARNLLDQEKRYRRAAEQDRDTLEKQITLVRDLLESNKVNDETKEKLAFLSYTNRNTSRHSEARANLDTINELESTGDILSELGYSNSDDEGDVSILRNGKQRRRSSRPRLPEDLEIQPKRRRSSRNKRDSMEVEITSGRVIATTTVTVKHQGPVTATSKLETIPHKKSLEVERTAPLPSAPPMPLESDNTSDDAFWKRTGFKEGRQGIYNKMNHKEPEVGYSSALSRINTRAHTFCTKNIIRPETCGPCGRKIKFAAKVMKCIDCRAVCHPECKDDIPLPCVPMGATPKKDGCIGDFTPMIPPMVPGLVIHCIQEIEKRGANEVGIYRVPGSERDVKALKEKFLKGKGVPDLSGVDLPVISGVLKDFLKSLRESLITQSRWNEFARSCERSDTESIRAGLYTCIANLPQPNRDTLAYVVSHLQRVAEWEECKMPIGNLAKIFGPTIVGYTDDHLDAQQLVEESRIQQNVMAQLLGLPADYWDNFLKADISIPIMSLRTPSFSAKRDSNNKPGYFTATPRSARALLGKKDKFFSTPQ